MRTGLFICAAWLAAAASPLADQQQKKDQTEKTIITVIGCVDGSWLHVRSADPVGSSTERYKLVGPKQLLKEIASQYKGHLIEVTGPVTDTAATTHRGKTIQVGKKTRITTLAKEAPSIPTGNDPTLGVNAYRHLKDSCS